MGPRSFNRGNDGAALNVTAGLLGFNGAAVFQPRKCSCDRMGFWLQSKLQWGRGLSTAEIAVSPRNNNERPLASMGPRSFNRGNCQPVSRREGGPRRLQWGRGLSTAEISIVHSLPSLVGRALQWGRGLSTAEMAQVDAGGEEAQQLQWGRGLSTAEITIFIPPTKPTANRFNGAAVFQPRK